VDEFRDERLFGARKSTARPIHARPRKRRESEFAKCAEKIRAGLPSSASPELECVSGSTRPGWGAIIVNPTIVEMHDSRSPAEISMPAEDLLDLVSALFRIWRRAIVHADAFALNQGPNFLATPPMKSELASGIDFLQRSHRNGAR